MVQKPGTLIVLLKTVPEKRGCCDGSCNFGEKLWNYILFFCIFLFNWVPPLYMKQINILVEMKARSTKYCWTTLFLTNSRIMCKTYSMFHNVTFLYMCNIWRYCNIYNNVNTELYTNDCPAVVKILPKNNLRNNGW